MGNKPKNPYKKRGHVNQRIETHLTVNDKRRLVKLVRKKGIAQSTFVRLCVLQGIQFFESKEKEAV